MLKCTLTALAAILITMPAYAQTKDVYSVHEAYATRTEISNGQARAIEAGERMRERYYEDVQDNSRALYPSSNATSSKPIREKTFND